MLRVADGLLQPGTARGYAVYDCFLMRLREMMWKVAKKEKRPTGRHSQCTKLSWGRVEQNWNRKKCPCSDYAVVKPQPISICSLHERNDNKKELERKCYHAGHCKSGEDQPIRPGIRAGLVFLPGASGGPWDSHPRCGCRKDSCLDEDLLPGFWRVGI